LNHLVAADSSETGGSHTEKTLGRLMGNAAPGFDSQGLPVLRMNVGDEAVSVGVAGGNIFAKDSSVQFAQQLLEARLREELRRGNPPKVSEGDVEHDWKMLKKAMNATDDQVADRSARPLRSGSQARWERDGNKP
jgi:hypothetical protein